MNRPPDPGLHEWVDDLARELGRLLEEPARWSAFDHLARPPPIDIEVALRGADSDPMRVAIIAARQMAMRIYMRVTGGPDLLGTPQDHNAWRLVHHVAIGAARDAVAVLHGPRGSWGAGLPAGLPALLSGRSARSLARAIATRGPSETKREVFARAGVSKTYAYRILRSAGEDVTDQDE